MQYTINNCSYHTFLTILFFFFFLRSTFNFSQGFCAKSEIMTFYVNIFETETLVKREEMGLDMLQAGLEPAMAQYV